MPSSPVSSEIRLYQPVVPHANAISIGWAYPYTAAVSMSSLGYLTLFKQLELDPRVNARRINTDNMVTEAIDDLALMGFSFSFELDILEILRMMAHFKLPFYARERPNNAPLLFAGGPVIMTNPEPYADFFDFFIIGEGEEAMANLITEYETIQHFTSRRERLIALAQNVPGIYVPSLYDVDYAASGEIVSMTPQLDGLPFPIEKQFVANMDTVIATTPILTADTVFSNAFLVEVMRGCAHRCRFCLASYSMLPARGPSLESIRQAIDFGLQHTSKIGLLGALIADHPEFDALCDYLKTIEGLQVSAASLRADTLTPHIAETFKHGGQKSVTLAIETGSERLRKRINKHLKTESILEAANIIARAGIPILKLYTMVGLPGETQDDLDDTVALVKQIKKANPTLKINVGNSTFVPKAATPFQWVSREPAKALQAKQEFLRKSLVKACDFRPSSAKWDTVQALFSRGDRRLSAWIVMFWQQGSNLGALNRAYKASNAASVDLPPPDWYAIRERPFSEILPWDVLFLGVAKDTLYRESGLAPNVLAGVTPYGNDANPH